MLTTILPSVFFIVLVLLCLSFILSVALMVYSFSIKDNKTAFLFGIIMIFVVLWSALKISCLFIYNVETREVLHYINIILVLPIPAIFLILSVLNTNNSKKITFWHLITLFSIPAIILMLVLISPFQPLIFNDFSIETEHGIPMHFYKMKAGYFLFDFYIYLVMSVSLVILIRSVINKDTYFRNQMFLFLIGGSIPFLYDVLYTFGVSPLKHYNMACVFISVGNVFFAWSLFGYRFFSLVPITRNVVVEKMADIMIVINHENIIIDINKSGKSFFGLEKGRFVGSSFYERFSDYPELISKYLHSEYQKDEIKLKKDENSYYYFDVKVTPVNSGNEFLASIIILHDITERINAEMKIRQLSVAVEQSPVSIIVTDTSGAIEYVNGAFSDTTGFSISDSIGQNPRILKGKTNPSVYSQLWTTLVSGLIWKGEFINKKKNGHYYYAETTIAPVKSDKGEIVKYIAVMNDITDRKESELKIKLQNNELHELNATKDKFFSLIAHDLKNPFNSILGLSYLLVNHFDSFEKEKIKQIISQIEITAGQTYKLLENLLEWSKIQQGRIIPILKSHNLFQLVEEVVAIYIESAKQKNIQIKNQLMKNTPVICDRDMTKTILRNLVSNSIKFTDRGGKISVCADIEEIYVKLKVIDTGIGMSEEKIKTIFKIDKNTSTPGTEDEKGTGLGLILCHEMIEKQGGSITVKSKPGKETIATITFKKSLFS
ncbi:MAG: PAS domain S-box protein [Bacteroidales bacterium]